MVERSLSMREVAGSMPAFSITFFSVSLLKKKTHQAFIQRIPPAECPHKNERKVTHLCTVIFPHLHLCDYVLFSSIISTVPLLGVQSFSLEYFFLNRHKYYRREDRQPRRDSNPQSSDPKSDALSFRPRGHADSDVYI